jgi:ABC-type glycerol-3-phosphate transport system permease component
VRQFGATIILAAWALPLCWMLAASVAPEAALFEGGIGPPTLAHYRAIFAERHFWRPVANSLVVAGTTAALAILIGTPAAYAVARLRLPGARWILAGVLAVSVFPQIAIVPTLFLLLRTAGLLDTYPGLVLPYLTFSLPLAVWLLAAFFRRVPRGLEEAALMDGATPLRAALLVVLPVAAPAIATTAILVFLYAWNEFLFALSFTLGPERQTAPVAIALLRGRYQVPWGQVLAAAVVASLPVAAVVLAVQRRIVSGLTAGAVKG